MELRSLVIAAVAVCAGAGVITAVADKGRPQDKASTAAAAQAPVTAPTAAQLGVSAGRPSGAAETARMKRIAFKPVVIHARIGDKLVWHNADNVVHNVTTERDPTGTSGIVVASPDIA